MANKKRASTRSDGSPRTVNVLNINGNLYSLGDLRKADFSALEDPKASVKSIQAWAKNLNNILRGFSLEGNSDES